MDDFSIPHALQLAAEKLSAGDLDIAEWQCREILKRQPRHSQALSVLSIVFWQRGDSARAVEFAAQAAAAQPGAALYHANLGEFLKGAGDLGKSIAAFRRAIDLKPHEAGFHNSLGTVLSAAKKHPEAVAAYERAIQLKTNYADAYGNLAGALRDLGRIDEADAAVEQAIRLKPLNASAYYNRAIIRTDQERFAEAIDSFQKALEIQPNYAIAQWSLGTLYLLLGDFEAGWKLYQHRPGAGGNFARPAWRGEDLKGKTILLHAEQGLGDTIQFLRYVPLLRERGANVWLAIQPELDELARGQWQVLRIGQKMPEYDYHCSLLSVPMGMGTNLSNIPASDAYLFPNPSLVNQWSERLGEKRGVRRIGLAWAGNPRHRDDARRSIELQTLRPLFRVPEVEFISLQVGSAARQAETHGLRDFSSALSDFSQTAALIANLDLIVTVDTSVAHLAGAMGKPTWLLLYRIPDWRWLLDRDDSPWYPSMTLFRQKVRGDWDEVIGRVATALATGHGRAPAV